MSKQQNFQLNDPKVINAWAMFDWANSVYYLIISTAIFPVYFTEIMKGGFTIGSTTISGESLLSYTVSLIYVVLAILSPVLSGIADYGGQKKLFLKAFTTTGAIACIGLWGFQGVDSLGIGLLGYATATIGAAGALVFYNAYLPEIVTEDRYDSVSAKGFTFGYVGSVILLIINLIMIQKFESFGFDSIGSATRLAFITVGLWWLGFAQFTIRRLPDNKKDVNTANSIQKGIEAIKGVWQDLKNQPNVARFLFSFLFYNAGVQTVIYLASIFAKQEFGFQTADLIKLILIIQLVGAVGAYFFAWLSSRIGNKQALMITLVIWGTVCIATNIIDKNSQAQFYVLGMFVGLVLGGVQSLSRASYAKLIPQKTQQTTSYFSFYDVVEKCSIVIGTFSFGFINDLTGSMRLSALALGVFFIIGIIIIKNVRFERIIKHEV